MKKVIVVFTIAFLVFAYVLMYAAGKAVDGVSDSYELKIIRLNGKISALEIREQIHLNALKQYSKITTQTVSVELMEVLDLMEDIKKIDKQYE